MYEVFVTQVWILSVTAAVIVAAIPIVIGIIDRR